jgi:hypothetical protein
MFTGCDQIDLFRDTWEGLTNPVVVEGIILGMEAAESDLIDLSATEYAEGTAATVWLADAQDAEQLEDAPVEGAFVDVEETLATDMTQGLYAIEPGPLEYVDGATWTITGKMEEDAPEEDLATADVELPPAADVDIPEEHTANTAITVDLTGMGYHSGLIAVINVATGEITYSNEPEDIRSFYDFTHGDDEAGEFEIPATAFPVEDTVYAVGVAGMVHSTSDALEGMNTLLSMLMSGKMRFYPVSTFVIPDEIPEE